MFKNGVCRKNCERLRGKERADQPIIAILISKCAFAIDQAANNMRIHFEFFVWATGSTFDLAAETERATSRFPSLSTAEKTKRCELWCMAGLGSQ